MASALERHCSELVARERSGHTAVVEDNLLYVWGGYMVRNVTKRAVLLSETVIASETVKGKKVYFVSYFIYILLYYLSQKLSNTADLKWLK